MMRLPVERVHSKNAVSPKDIPMSIGEARARLPKVGDRMRLHPETLGDGQMVFHGKLWCEVIYVNQEHLYFTVLFNGINMRESYKAIGPEAQE